MKKTQDENVFPEKLVPYLIVAREKTSNLARREFGKRLAQPRLRRNALHSRYYGLNYPRGSSRVHGGEEFMDADQITLCLFRPMQRHNES